MIRATLARGAATLPADRYACRRCGRVAKFNLPRGRPELCRDCLDLKAMEAAS